MRGQHALSVSYTHLDVYKRQPVINIAPENNRPNGTVHKGIRIENNRFTLKDKQAIYARWTDNIRISGNYFDGILPVSKKESVLLEHCTNVDSE